MESVEKPYRSSVEADGTSGAQSWAAVSRLLAFLSIAFAMFPAFAFVVVLWNARGLAGNSTVSSGKLAPFLLLLTAYFIAASTSLFAARCWIVGQWRLAFLGIAMSVCALLATNGILF